MRGYVLVLLFSLAVARVDATSRIEGRWTGFQGVEETQQSIGLTVDGAGSGAIATVDFPASGFVRIPLMQLVADGNSLEGRFWSYFHQGTLHVELEGEVLAGTITTKNYTAELRLERNTRIPERTETGVTFQSPGATLAGRLFMPGGDGPHPGIVLVDGSGDTHRPFLYWYAEWFCDLGFAVLLYDKRGCGGSTGNWHEVGFDGLADDVVAATAFLRKQPQVDPRRIGWWGISQAGWVMPMAATRPDPPAFMIVVSGGGVTVEREGHWDAEYFLPRHGFGPDVLEQAQAYISLDDRVTRTGKGLEEQKAAYARIKDEPWFDIAQLRAPLPMTAWFRPWYRSIMDVDHRPFVAGLTMPVVWFYGDDDDTFPSVEAAGMIREIGAANGRSFDVHMLPKTGHMMLVSPGPDAAIPVGQLNGKYLDAMQRWVLDRAGLPPK